MVPQLPPEGSVEVLETQDVPPCKGTLAERICAIQSEIGNIEATGTNFAKGQAISIEDVAKSVRPLKAKHGVLIRFSCKHAEDLGGKNWRVDLIAHVESVADKADCFEDEWVETGMNLSAAYSYGRKSYQKMLFDIASNKDDDDSSQRGSVPRARQSPQRPPDPSDPDPGIDQPFSDDWALGHECPVEGCTGRVGGSRTARKCSSGHTPDGEA